jgi:DNA-binding NarL/FixJ family response regulator
VFAAENKMNTPAPKRLLVVDDHPVFRHGIAQLIGTLSEVTICGEAENAQTALQAMRRLQPEVALLDISMPGTNGIELIKHMLAEQPRLIILTLSMHDESLYALRALRAGAKGYVMKQQAADASYLKRSTEASAMWVRRSIRSRIANSRSSTFWVAEKAHAKSQTACI